MTPKFHNFKENFLRIKLNWIKKVHLLVFWHPVVCRCRGGRKSHSIMGEEYNNILYTITVFFREKRKKIVIVTFGVIKVTKSQASMLLFSNYRLVMLRTSLRLELLKTHWLLHSVVHYLNKKYTASVEIELSIHFCRDLRF